MMEWLLFVILIIVCILSLVEDRTQKYNYAIYVSLTVILVLFAGLREVGFDRDSENYEQYYLHYDDPLVELTVEPSFRVLSAVTHFFSDDVHVLFLMYAMLGIPLKMIALRKITSLWFLPIAVYLGHYYILHDLTQIRASVVSGLTLFAIPLLCQGKRKIAGMILLLCCFFHYSAFSLLPLLFFGNKEMTTKERWIWGALLPLGYAFHFIAINFTVLFDNIPYISDKLERYEELRDKGITGEKVNVLNPVFLMKCFVYVYILYFYDTVKSFNKYATIIVKMMGIYVFTFPALSLLPIVAIRVSELYGVVEIVMFTYIATTMRPAWLGKTVVVSAAVIMFAIDIFIEKILEPI